MKTCLGRMTVAAAALTLVLSGCGATPAAAPNTVATTGKSPQAVLLASIPQRSSVPFRFSVSGGDDTISGVIDGRRTAARFDLVNYYASLGYAMNMSIIVLDRKSWVRIRYQRIVHNGPKVPSTWMTMDADRGGSGRGGPFRFGAENDPGLAADVFEYGTEIHPTGPGRYAGVTDLSSMYGGRILTPPHLDAIKARTAPFTAVVDGQGRLTALELPLPVAGAYKATTYRVTYDQYGTAVPLEPPDAEAVTSATDSVYHLFDDAQFAGPMIG